MRPKRWLVDGKLLLTKSEQELPRRGSDLLARFVPGLVLPSDAIDLGSVVRLRCSGPTLAKIKALLRQGEVIYHLDAPNDDNGQTHLISIERAPVAVGMSLTASSSNPSIDITTRRMRAGTLGPGASPQQSRARIRGV